ncbi:MAG: hypothetical protein H6568_06110 [Lewinellaceae bacterium]|nr:hypothetical protein [Lewinellaceae bacterium]
MRLFFLALVMASLPSLASAQKSDLQEALYALPDVIFIPMDSPEGVSESYVLKIRQPLDHQHPEKGSFWQRVYLEHTGFDKPMTIVTHGYNVTRDARYELSQLLQGNQLLVEHRFFGESMPDSVDYTYLTLEQATADYHRIRELFRDVYPGKWLSTGISKGGQTTIFYRYFYPEDVDVSFPFVAPINHSVEDPRIYTFLDTVGTAACRKALYDVQVRLLKARDQVLPRVSWFARGAGLQFTYLTLEQAWEYTVLEYPFSFWQWGSDCADIPGKDVSIDSLLSHVLKVSDFGFFSDRDIIGFASHYYQAGTQAGYYGYQTRPFKGLLHALPTDTNPSAVFMPNHMPIRFDPTLTNTVFEWTQTKGDHIIYLNGSSDTWSATAVPHSDQVDAAWFFLPGTDHRAARIKNLSPAERARMVQVLEGWLGMEIE